MSLQKCRNIQYCLGWLTKYLATPLNFFNNILIFKQMLCTSLQTLQCDLGFKEKLNCCRHEKVHNKSNRIVQCYNHEHSTSSQTAVEQDIWKECQVGNYFCRGEEWSCDCCTSIGSCLYTFHFSPEKAMISLTNINIFINNYLKVVKLQKIERVFWN